MHSKKPISPTPLAAFAAPAPRRTANALGANAHRADSRKADIRRADSAKSAEAPGAEASGAESAAAKASGAQVTATQTAGAQTVPTFRTEPASRTAPADPRPASRRRRPSPDAELQRWLAKYEPVERAIIEERARRLASAEKRRMKRRLAFAAECEETEGLATVLRRKRSGGKRHVSVVRGAEGRGAASAPGGAPLARIGNTNLHVLDGGIVSVFLWVLGVKCTRDVDAMRHRLKRPLYYARENARRRALAADRRKVRLRMPAHPCPTREEVLDAWVHAKDSREAMLRFGGMMEDLECYVDNSLRYGRNGEVVGRAPGIKGWLQMNIPALYSKYKTIMRYKAAAKKLRQVVGLRDPMPVSTILARTAEGGQAVADGEKAENRREFPVGGANEIFMRTKSRGAEDRHAEDGMRGSEGRLEPVNQWTDEERRAEMRRRGEEELRKAREEVAVEALRARAVYLEAMDGVPDNATRTMQRLDELLDPERIEDATMLKAWREKYENEITMRTKSRWFKSLFGGIKKDRKTA